MYKLKNPYSKAYMMDLNLMTAQDFKRIPVSGTDILITLAVVFLCIAIITLPNIKNMEFLAECQNTTGGDICSISLK